MPTSVLKELPIAHREEIVDAYLSGKTCKAIADDLGVTVTTVTKFFKIWNVPLRSFSERYSRRKIDKSQWPEVARLYDSGLRMVEVGKHFGVHANTVKYILLQQKVKIRNKGSYQQPLSKLTELERQQVLTAYKNGFTATEIGQQFGLNQTDVSKFLRRNGVEIRKSPKDPIARKRYSCTRRKIPPEQFEGFSKPERSRFMNTDEYKQWRMGVFKRDHFTCRLCKKKRVVIHAHHIRRYATHPELRLASTNGITLCKQCHEGVTQREDEFIEVFESLILESPLNP